MTLTPMLRSILLRVISLMAPPNYLSPDDTFFAGVRQKPISQKNLAKWDKETKVRS